MERTFDEDECLKKIRHYLPTQATLKDFVHHNPLHAFQDKEFFEAIFTAAKIFGFKSTFNVSTYRKLYEQGRIRPEILDRVISMHVDVQEVPVYRDKLLTQHYEQVYEPRIGQLRAHWKSDYHIDIDNLVQPLLFRIIGSYLDQGIALWHFPFEDKGLINALKILEENSVPGFFRSARVKELLLSDDLNVEKLLKIIVGDSRFFENYLFDQQFAHKGWSGIVCVLEDDPGAVFYKKNILFRDLVVLELLLEIDAADRALGKDWPPISSYVTGVPLDYLSQVPTGELEEVRKIWQEAFEWTYYDAVLAAVGHKVRAGKTNEPHDVDFQAIFCVDDRECSLRRHIEAIDASCITYGAPGHFGVPIYFQALGARFPDKSCPVNVTPTHLIKETAVSGKRPHEILHSKRTHAVWSGLVSALSLGWVAGYRMITDLLNPKMRPDISNAFAHMDVQGKLLIEAPGSNPSEMGLQVGFCVEEMADIVEALLKGIGMVSHFAKLVYVVAHGSSSANNPHHGAHDCGACSGRPGAVNARVFAFMANHPGVRTVLKSRGFSIPDATWFVGAMHDTASDEIVFYDENELSATSGEEHDKYREMFEQALDLNALERSRRFASINTKKGLKHVRREIKKRSVSYFEPRPELGHGTNALCYVGTREKIKGIFLDRRAFLQSYDYRTDPEGTVLQKVLAPLPGVCGGINLEYYFSRMDIEKMGAGTKLPHNVTGLIGVTNSSDGDLRTGLPLQMIENHDPVRLLMIVEHEPEIILRAIRSSKEMYDWFAKGWLHLVALSPLDGHLYRFSEGNFHLYEPLSGVVETEDILDIIVKSREMESGHISDATKENIPAQIMHNKTAGQ